MRVLKLQLGEEVRRLLCVPEDLSTVKQKATEFFGIECPCFRYTDEDNDKITILNQEDYVIACSIHNGPLKLEVLDSEVLLLKRSSILNSSIHRDPSFSRGSFEESSIILQSEPDFKIQEHSVMVQTDEICVSDKETLSYSHQDFAVDGIIMNDASNFCEDSNDPYAEITEFIRNQVKKTESCRNEYLGVKCYKCKNEIYDVLYRCSCCSWFFICEMCEIGDTHVHVLIKSREIVRRIPSKSVEKPSITVEKSKNDCKPHCEIETPKGSREELKNKMEKLKTMGFSDDIKNAEVLVRTSYDLEKSIEFLVSS